MVRVYHKRQGVRLPEPFIHAAFHVVVENQIALGDELPVKARLAELLREGLDRHEAIHAIGSVLAEHMWRMTRGELADEDPHRPYIEALAGLTASSWREQYASEGEG